jgi:glyoxylase-like metal-dependent hydrolase (beta-lactamase superfamily II)
MGRSASPDRRGLRSATATLDVPGTPRVILVPGHTPGSAALHMPSHDALFIGDAIATYSVTTGVDASRIAPFTADPVQALASLVRLDAVEAGYVLPGHGQAWTRGVAAALAEVRAAATSSVADTAHPNGSVARRCTSEGLPRVISIVPRRATVPESLVSARTDRMRAKDTTAMQEPRERGDGDGARPCRRRVEDLQPYSPAWTPRCCVEDLEREAVTAASTPDDAEEA